VGLPHLFFQIVDPKEVLTGSPGLVYCWCMSRTNIDIDDDACAEVMRRYRLATKRDAVNFALRALAAEPLTIDEARALRGSGWEGDLDTMREGRSK
jgi:Arc/MetJ family transcription regulator